MLDIYHIFNSSRDLIHILFILSLSDLMMGWIKAKISKEWSSKKCLIELWKKLSNFILLLLSGVVGYIFSKNGIKLEISFVHIFSCLLILMEIENLLEKLSETEIVQLLISYVQELTEKLKPNHISGTDKHIK